MRRRTKIILAVIGVVIVLPFAQIGLIVAQAQHLANGRPYCIEASEGQFGQYRPIGSLLELNALTLQAPYVGSSGSIGFAQFTFHALLAIDNGRAPEWRNWSYWNQRFDELTAQQEKANGLFRVECQPKLNFVWKLPLLAR
jgi:hypothetical protein